MSLKDYYEMDASHQAAFRAGQAFQIQQDLSRPNSDTDEYSAVDLAIDVVGSMRAFWEDVDTAYVMHPPDVTDRATALVRTHDGDIYNIEVSKRKDALRDDE